MGRRRGEAEEDRHPPDRGCRYHPKCLTCTEEPDCRFSTPERLPPSERKLINAERDAEIRRLKAEKSYGRLAIEFNLTRRQIINIVKEG